MVRGFQVTWCTLLNTIKCGNGCDLAIDTPTGGQIEGKPGWDLACGLKFTGELSQPHMGVVG